MRHLIIAGVLVVIVTAVLLVGLNQTQILPDPAAAQAEPIDRMFKLEFQVIVFLFALIVVLMVYSILVFRRKKDDTTDAKHIEGNTRLEVFWTLIPLATVLVFAYLGSGSLAETMRVNPQALDVNVIATQWSWRFEYPELGVTSTELWLPVDQQVLLNMTSQDVIHSFWVPEFRVKQDILPGADLERQLRITPDKIGNYTLYCAEMCGRDHAVMSTEVKVISQADFDAWVAEQTVVSDDPVERGRVWSEQFGCNACHTLDGSEGVGPSWAGLYDENVTLTDGSTVVADHEYLYQAICDPASQIVEGFQPIMPPNYCEDNITDDQIDDIIAFIESLK
jgi:cytochrome c oxidase subunit 2